MHAQTHINPCLNDVTNYPAANTHPSTPMCCGVCCLAAAHLVTHVMLAQNNKQITSVHTILASNTSSISITKLGSATSKPHRVVSE